MCFQPGIEQWASWNFCASVGIRQLSLIRGMRPLSTVRKNARTIWTGCYIPEVYICQIIRIVHEDTARLVVDAHARPVEVVVVCEWCFDGAKGVQTAIGRHHTPNSPCFVKASINRGTRSRRRSVGSYGASALWSEKSFYPGRRFNRPHASPWSHPATKQSFSGRSDALLLV